MATVWVLGSMNVDDIVAVERHPKPGETVLGGPLQTRFGGKGANQAIAAARAGARVRMVGRVGDDSSGRDYRERLAAFGVDVTDVALDADAPTGHAAIAVAADGENTIVVSPGANGRVGAQELTALEGLARGDVLLLQLEVPLTTVADAVRVGAAHGARVVVNVAPYAPVDPVVLATADPVVANESEAGELAASGAAPEHLLVTRGGAGSDWGGLHQAAERAALVVDTTGAGDTYCGALAARLAAGDEPAAAMAVASRVAALSVEWPGAQPEPETGDSMTDHPSVEAR
ncbi:ribokinase [uncultured Amnibacterium sp.]|uniref:ribokinase n=1 Tax=uncultured Amnibacterium sp. TaxID=1631851 RepID=UPI0035CC6149